MIASPLTDTVELRTEEIIIDRIAAVAQIILVEESKIDTLQTVYLITWCPDPKELPNSDFDMQHLFNVDILSDFLKQVKCGLFCVETTQLGNPHYHGWYQLSNDPTRTKERLAILKTLQRLGFVKVTQARTVRKNQWFERKNGLYYYKKDSIDEMLFARENPIHKESKFDYDWVSSMFFTLDLKNSSIQNKISDKKFYLQFYNDSIKY